MEYYKNALVESYDPEENGKQFILHVSIMENNLYFM
jgi:hypothetical protein